jgi:hypothetical protein
MGMTIVPLLPSVPSRRIFRTYTLMSIDRPTRDLHNAICRARTLSSPRVVLSVTDYLRPRSAHRTSVRHFDGSYHCGRLNGVPLRKPHVQAPPVLSVTFLLLGCPLALPRRAETCAEINSRSIMSFAPSSLAESQDPWYDEAVS